MSALLSGCKASFLAFLILIATPALAGHGVPCGGGCAYSWQAIVQIGTGSATFSGSDSVADTDLAVFVTSLPFDPNVDTVLSFSITETATSNTFYSDLTGDVFEVAGDSVVAWLQLGTTPRIYASTLQAQHANHLIAYTLKAEGTESPSVDFSARMTASGTERRTIQVEYSDGFPNLSLSSGASRKCTDIITDQVCLPAGCTIDLTRTYSTTPGSEAAGWPFGAAGPGYGIVINSMLTKSFSNKQPFVDHDLVNGQQCLTSRIRVCRGGTWTGGAWYDADHFIYGECEMDFNWTQTQDQGPFSLTRQPAQTHLTDYTGPIGSGNANTLVVHPGTIYSVTPLNQTPVLANLNLNMVVSGSNPNNGNELWGITDYFLNWQSFQSGSAFLNEDDGVELLGSIPVVAPDNNTVYSIDALSSVGIGYDDRNGDGTIDAGDLQAWMSSIGAGNPDWNLFAAFNVDPPLAVIDTINPAVAGVGAPVVFNGHGVPGSGGPIINAWWRSNRVATPLHTCTTATCNFVDSSLAPGQHLISLQVEEDVGGGVGSLLSANATDILRINTAPIASITDITSTGSTPFETVAIKYRDDAFDPFHDVVTFTGQAIDLDGVISSYQWESDRDGVLSTQATFTANDLSIGRHVISFSAVDDSGVSSNVATRQLRVMRPPTLLVHGLCSSPGSWTDDDGVTEGGTITWVGADVNVPPRALDPVLVDSNTTVTIFTLFGTQVRTATIPQGDNHFVWDGTDDFGSPVANGAYVFSLDFGTNIDNLIGAYYPIETIDITPSDAPISVGAEQVGDRVQDMTQDWGVPDVNIVAHSMGGLNSRWYIQNFGYAGDVNKLVMLATPNHGSTLAAIARPGQAGAHAAVLWNPTNPVGQTLVLLAALLDLIIDFCATDDLIPQSANLQLLNGNAKDEGFSHMQPDDEIDTIFGGPTSYFNVWSGNIPSFSHVHVQIPFTNVFFIKGTLSFKTDSTVHKRSALIDNVPDTKVGWVLHEPTSLRTNAEGLDRTLFYLGDDPPEASGDDGGPPEDATTTLAGHLIATSEGIDTVTGGTPAEHDIEVDAEIDILHVAINNPSDASGLSLVLERPDGLLVPETTTLPNVVFDSGPTQRSFHVTAPMAGTWKAHVSLAGAADTSSEYGLMAFGETDFWVGVHEGGVQEPGDPFVITARALKNGAFATGMNVEAVVSKILDDGPKVGSRRGPDWEFPPEVVIPLVDMADGSYEATFTDTSRTGTYRVFITMTDMGTGVERSIVTSFSVEENHDLAIDASNITCSDPTPVHGQLIQVGATIQHVGVNPAQGVPVAFYDGRPDEGGRLIAERTVDLVAGGTATTSVSWSATAGDHEVFVIVSPQNTYGELDLTNNAASKLVSVPDAPPFAQAGDDIRSRVGDNVFLDGSESTDDVGIVSYSWSIVSSPGGPVPGTLTGEQVVVPGGLPMLGNYVFQLTVEDTEGQLDTDTIVVRMTDDYDLRAPVADAGPDQTVLVGQAVQLDGSGSSDDFGVASYAWDLDLGTDTSGNGNPADDVDLVGKRPVLTDGYGTVGTRWVRLSVNDVAGNGPVSDTLKITVREPNPDCTITVPISGIIQDYVDDATPGDWVCVTPSTYEQSVVLAKSGVSLDCQGARLVPPKRVIGPPVLDDELPTERSSSRDGFGAGQRRAPSAPSTPKPDLSNIGIQVAQGASDLTVQNCWVEGFDIGFHSAGGRSATLPVRTDRGEGRTSEDRTGESSAEPASDAGDVLDPPPSHPVSFLSNTAYRNGTGFASIGTDTLFDDNEARENERGFTEAGTRSQVESNRFLDNGSDGFAVLTGASGLGFVRNRACDNGVDINRVAAASAVAFGDLNVCDSTTSWDDQGTSGCTLSCPLVLDPVTAATRRLVLTDDLLLTKGIYSLPDGITIAASKVVLRCEDAIIRGNSQGTGLRLFNERGHREPLGDVIVDGCSFEDYDVGVSIQNAEGTVLEDVRVERARTGVGIGAAHGTTLRDVSVTADRALVIGGESTGNQVERGRYEGTSTGNDAVAVFVKGHGNVLSGMTVRQGVTLAGSDNQVLDSTIRGGRETSALTILGGRGNVVSGNRLGAARSNGLLLQHATGNRVLDNVFHDVRQAVRLTTSRENVIEGNLLTDDRGLTGELELDDAETVLALSAGLFATDCESNQVLSNDFSGVGRSGIELLRSTGFVIEGNLVTQVGEMGVLLTESHANTIRGNDAKAARQASIGLTYSNENEVLENRVSEGELGAIFEVESHGNLIRGNGP
ncbi:MAG: NosD domain-containing protein [Acidobacteriota bacterium]